MNTPSPSRKSRAYVLPSKAMPAAARTVLWVPSAPTSQRGEKGAGEPVPGTVRVTETLEAVEPVTRAAASSVFHSTFPPSLSSRS